MKKKFYLIIALLLALAVSGGIFAFTYTTASASIGVTAVASDFAEVEGFQLTSAWEAMGSEIGDVPGGMGIVERVVDGTLLEIQIDLEIQIEELSAGEKIFSVTPHSNYTGDLVVKVYISNADELVHAYQHLNMKIIMKDSEEWSDAGHKYQLLTLDNAEVTFNLNGMAGEACLVELAGGSYAANPQSNLQWGSSAVSPQLYCEVTQR